MKTNLPETPMLLQNYPNPFNSVTSIKYVFPTSDAVEVSIYNLVGQKVKTLFSGYQSAGSHQVA